MNRQGKRAAPGSQSPGNTKKPKPTAGETAVASGLFAPGVESGENTMSHPGIDALTSSASASGSSKRLTMPSFEEILGPDDSHATLATDVEEMSLKASSAVPGLMGKGKERSLSSFDGLGGASKQKSGLDDHRLNSLTGVLDEGMQVEADELRKNLENVVSSLPPVPTKSTPRFRLPLREIFLEGTFETELPPTQDFDHYYTALEVLLCPPVHLYKFEGMPSQDSPQSNMNRPNKYPRSVQQNLIVNHIYPDFRNADDKSEDFSKSRNPSLVEGKPLDRMLKIYLEIRQQNTAEPDEVGQQEENSKGLSILREVWLGNKTGLDSNWEREMFGKEDSISDSTYDITKRTIFSTLFFHGKEPWEMKELVDYRDFLAYITKPPKECFILLPNLQVGKGQRRGKSEWRLMHLGLSRYFPHIIHKENGFQGDARAFRTRPEVSLLNEYLVEFLTATSKTDGYVFRRSKLGLGGPQSLLWLDPVTTEVNYPSKEWFEAGYAFKNTDGTSQPFPNR